MEKLQENEKIENTIQNYFLEQMQLLIRQNSMRCGTK